MPSYTTRYHRYIYQIQILICGKLAVGGNHTTPRNNKLIQYVNDNEVTREKIDKDETVRWTLTTPLYNIGEHVYNLSDEFKEKHADVPWDKISGLRHRMVHDYDNTNWSIISEIVFIDIPELQKQLSELHL